MKQPTPQLIVGRDIPDLFSQDLFEIRRGNVGAGNPYDPESLLTGEEAAKGYTYANSRRAWPSQADYFKAIRGKMTTEDILRIAPRRLLQPLGSEVLRPQVGPRAA